MGLLDLPAPLFDRIDGTLLGFLPPLARVLIWAAAGAAISMELYRILSPQSRVARLKVELLEAQGAVSKFDGELEDAWPLLGRMLSLAFQRIFAVLPATLIASLPVLMLVVWLDGAYGHSFPAPGAIVGVQAPAPFTGKWMEGAGGEPPHAVVLDQSGTAVSDTALRAPVPVLHKRRWWNFLLGNPAGYLAPDAPIESIGIALPERHILAIGPVWLRGWEPSFFLAVLLIAMTLKWVRKID